MRFDFIFGSQRLADDGGTAALASLYSPGI